MIGPLVILISISDIKEDVIEPAKTPTRKSLRLKLKCGKKKKSRKKSKKEDTVDDAADFYNDQDEKLVEMHEYSKYLFYKSFSRQARSTLDLINAFHQA